jgi:hypothetical protein
MEKEFIPYELALEMKQIGFDEPCFGYWYTEQEEFKKIDIQLSSISFLEGEPDYILAPTFSQCFRWFRDVYGLNHEIPISGSPKEYYAFVQNYSYGNNGNRPSIFSYEEAEIECIKKLIEIVKENKT